MRSRGTWLRWLPRVSFFFALAGCVQTTVVVDGDGGRDAATPDARVADAGARDARPADAGADDAGADGGVELPCPAYHERCRGSCVPVTDDPARCGACGSACGSGEVCFAGRCEMACPPDLAACAGRCVDLRLDSEHCGACGGACAASTGCVESRCEPSVASGGAPDCAAAPPILFPGTAEDGECSGEVAETTFRWALCSCEDVELFNPLETDAFDSRTGPYRPGGAGGGVGSNGGFSSSSTGDVGGTLWAASPRAGVLLSNRFAVAHELQCGGVLDVGNPLTVGGDAFVAGDLVTSDAVVIAGRLHQPPGARVVGDVTYDALVTEPVVVGDPCDCDARDRIPVGSIVAAAARANDNAAIGLDPAALSSVSAPRRLDLPCGRYFLRGVDTSQPLVIHASGRSALFVEGDLRSTSDLYVTVAPGAELDLLVSGTVEVSGTLAIGSPIRPASSRVYIGGLGDALTLTNDTEVGGFVYVAAGAVVGSNPIEVYGGVFAGRFRNAGSTRIHFDRAVLRAGDDCPPPDRPCDSCADCGNQACLEGACGGCTASADCCAPLVCFEGECVLLE